MFDNEGIILCCCVAVIEFLFHSDDNRLVTEACLKRDLGIRVATSLTYERKLTHRDASRHKWKIEEEGGEDSNLAISEMGNVISHQHLPEFLKQGFRDTIKNPKIRAKGTGGITADTIKALYDDRVIR